MLYLVSYELERPLNDYPELLGFIDQQKPQAHVLENTWLLESSDLPYNMQREIETWLGPRDRIYIGDVSKSIIAWSNLEGEVGDFIGRFTQAVEQEVSHQLLLVAFDGPLDERWNTASESHQSALGVWKPLLTNLYQIETDASPEKMIAHVREVLGGERRILVADISLAPAAWLHLPEDSAYAAVAYTRQEQGPNRQEF